MEVSAALAFRELAELRRKNKAKHKSYKDYLANQPKFNPALYAAKGAKTPVINPK